MDRQNVNHEEKHVIISRSLLGRKETVRQMVLDLSGNNKKKTPWSESASELY
jgi:hypothetical protein